MAKMPQHQNLVFGLVNKTVFVTNERGNISLQFCTELSLKLTQNLEQII